MSRHAAGVAPALLAAAFAIACGAAGEPDRIGDEAEGEAAGPPAARIPPVSVRDPAAGPHWPGIEARFDLETAAAGDFRPCSLATPTLGTDRFGPIRPGATQVEVIDVCADAYRAWNHDAPVPRPVLVVRLGEVVAELALADTLPDSPVRVIAIADALVRTDAGVGPGSMLVELVDAYGWPDLYEGDCVVFADFDAVPTLGWELRVPPEEGLDCTDVERAGWANDPSLLPPSTYVERVVLSGRPS